MLLLNSTEHKVQLRQMEMLSLLQQIKNQTNKNACWWYNRKLTGIRSVWFALRGNQCLHKTIVPIHFLDSYQTIQENYKQTTSITPFDMTDMTIPREQFIPCPKFLKESKRNTGMCIVIYLIAMPGC